MKKFFEDFKNFISKGNVIDMAVGVVIGAAFSSIVDSLVNDIIMPVVGRIIGGVDFSSLKISLGGDANILIGSFIQNVINFLIIAFVIFVVVREIGKLKEKFVHEEKANPTTKACPYCKSEINIEATRCPECTSQLEVK